MHTLNMCRKDTTKMHTKVVSILHVSKMSTANRAEHTCKAGQVCRKQFKLEECTHRCKCTAYDGIAVLWKESSKCMTGAYDE
jgi:hypothetical protein